MKRRGNRRVVALCTCAISAALSVLIMGIGAALEIADLSCALIASLAVWLAQIEFGSKYAVYLYLASALLAFILIPVPFPAFYYTLLFGWYPIFKFQIDKRLANKKVSALCKIPVIVIVVLAEELLARLLLGYIQTAVLTILIVLVSCVLYLPYDILLARLAVLYRKKWRNYIF